MNNFSKINSPFLQSVLQKCEAKGLDNTPAQTQSQSQSQTQSQAKPKKQKNEVVEVEEFSNTTEFANSNPTKSQVQTFMAMRIKNFMDSIGY